MLFIESNSDYDFFRFEYEFICKNRKNRIISGSSKNDRRIESHRRF